MGTIESDAVSSTQKRGALMWERFLFHLEGDIEVFSDAHPEARIEIIERANKRVLVQCLATRQTSRPLFLTVQINVGLAGIPLQIKAVISRWNAPPNVLTLNATTQRMDFEIDGENLRCDGEILTPHQAVNKLLTTALLEG
jgi:hypothetical protein